MNKDEVLQMARDSGFREDVFSGGPRKGKASIFDYGDVDIYSTLERFAHLVEQRTREECARICEESAEESKRMATGCRDGRYDHAADGMTECAAAIRATSTLKDKP